MREYRVDERERQRACRARQRAAGGLVSRTGLAAQVPPLQHLLLEIVDRQAEVSRAGLRRELARALRVRSPEVGQNGVVGL